MARIICDCTVWYRLANGEFLEKIAGHDLVATYVNFEELATSWYLTKNIKYAKQVLTALWDNYNVVISDNPFDYVMKSFTRNYESNDTVFNAYKLGHSKLLAADVNPVPSDESIETMEGLIKKVEGVYQNLADCINGKMTKFKAEYDGMDEAARKTYWDVHSLGNSKETIVEELSKYYGHAISQNAIPWQYFELLERSLNAYLRKIEEHISANDLMKSRKNDFPDLFNLVYVEPGQKYYTMDGIGGGGTIDVIKRAGLGYYLF